MEIQYAHYLLYTFLSYHVVYLVGSLFCACLPGSGGFREEFKKLTLGMIAVIGGYSLLRSGFVSMSLGLLIPAAAWYAWSRPAFAFRWRFNPAGYATGLLILTGHFTWLYFDLYDPIRKIFYYYQMDLPVYATYVEQLIHNGLESTSTDMFLQYPLRNVYNYGYLWFSAFFVRLFGLNAMQSVYFIFTAIGGTAILTGAMALAEALTGGKRLRAQQVFISLAFMFLSGISFYVPKVGYWGARWAEVYNIFNTPKVFLAVIPLLWTAIALLRGNYRNATLFLLLAVVFYPVTAPALLMAWGTGMLLLLLFRQLSWKEVVIIAVPVMLVVAFFGLYVYAITQVNNQYYDADALIGVVGQADLKDPLFYKLIVTTTFDATVRHTISMAPFLLLLLYFRRQVLADKPLVVLLVYLGLGLCFALFTYGLTAKDLNAFQFWMVPNAPLAALFVFVLLIRLDFRFIFKLALVLVCIYQVVLGYTDADFYHRPFAYNREFIGQVMTEIRDNKENNYVTFRKPIKKENSAWDSNYNLYQPYNFLKFFVDNYNPYCLTMLGNDTLNGETAAAYQRSFTSNSPFSRFVSKQKKSGTFVSVEQSQLDFIREAKIRYVLIEPGSVENEQLLPLIAREYTDTLAGYRFCVLKQPL